MKDTVKNFLNEHGFYTDLNLGELTESIRNDMINRYLGKESYQDMIPTYIDPSSIKLQEKTVIVIDAGGTNFRSSLVKFAKDGKASVSDFEKTRMPGTEGELTKSEFFGKIAKNIERFKGKCNEICFCFSYAMTITENHDGILTNFSKEVKAPQVVGSYIGLELKKALAEQGWSKDLKIILLNDTVSALLAGVSEKNYSSYIGFILGTGLNAAFLQPESKEFELKKQIVVCESAKFGGFKNSDFDILLDDKSVKPGSAPYEKLCSGAYMGTLALETIHMASKEGIFSDEFSKEITLKDTLSLIEVNLFLQNYQNGEKNDNFKGATEEDMETLFEIFDALVNRMAQLAACVLAACILQCGEGKEPEKPVCVACNGTSFFKTYKVIDRTKEYLALILQGKDLHYEILADEADITRGTAMAAFAM